MDLKKIRRELHQIPETQWNTKNTCSFIKNIVKDYDCMYEELLPNSLVVYFDFGKEKTIAFRSDMDALPIEEKNTHDFISKNKAMHACGHDGHMSMLLGLAEYLNECKKEKTPVKSNVLLIFQPAEERPGGAKPLIDAGLFEKYPVHEIYGFHIYPNLPAGKIVTRKKELMAGACNLIVEFKGKAAHQAMPELGADALCAAAEFITLCKQKVSLLLDPDVFYILGFGTFHAGNSFNIIAEKADITGTIRYYDPKVFDRIMELVKECGHQMEEKFHVTFSYDIDQHYPPVLNDEALINRLEDIELLKDPVMIAEDFAYYQQKVPGVFLFIGSGMEEPLHSSTFDFNEDLLQAGLNFYKKILQ